MKKLLCLLLAGALLVSQTACAGRELYQRVLVHAMGVDWDQGEYTVTVRAASAPGEENEECLSCRGRTVAEALGALSLSAGREPFYAHNYLVIFGRAVGENCLSDALDFFLRFHNVHPTVQLYLAGGEAAELLTREEQGKLAPVAQLQRLGEAQEDTGRAVRVELLDFINTANRPGASPLLPQLVLTKEGPRTRGACFFRDQALQGELTGEDLMGFLAAKGRLEGGSLLIEHPDLGRVTVAFTGSHPRAEVTLEEGVPRFTLEITLEGDAVSIDGGRHRLAPEDYPLAEAVLAREMEERLRTLWEKTAVAAGCDVLGLGAMLSRRDPHAWAAVEERWPELLPGCGFQVQVQAHISRLEAP